jgi:hypothetical protein
MIVWVPIVILMILIPFLKIAGWRISSMGDSASATTTPPAATPVAVIREPVEVPLGKCSGFKVLDKDKPSKDFDVGNCFSGYTRVSGEFDIWGENGLGIAHGEPQHIGPHQSYPSNKQFFVTRIEMTTPSGVLRTVECPVGSEARDYKCWNK